MKIAFLALAGALFTIGCTATPPKVMVAQNFNGDDKNVETLIQSNGQKTPGGQGLFDVSVRVCDVNDTAISNNCKDSKVLDNVLPQSIY